MSAEQRIADLLERVDETAKLAHDGINNAIGATENLRELRDQLGELREGLRALAAEIAARRDP